MTVQYLAWLGLTLVSTVFLALWLRLRRRLPEAIQGLSEHHTDNVVALRELNARLQAEVEAQTRKSAEYFKVIEAACKERDFWRSWYHRQATEHAHAQGYLMTRYENLVVAFINATGKKPAMDPVLKSLVEEFRETHPVLADIGRGANDDPLPEAPGVSGPVDNLGTTGQ